MSAAEKKRYGEAEWKPDWSPPDMEFPNKVSIDDYKASSFVAITTLGMFLIERSVYVSGKFSEIFELDDFPFDTQDLQI